MNNYIKENFSFDMKEQLDFETLNERFKHLTENY